MSASPMRTLAGPLTAFRTNKREAGVLEFAKQLQTALWDFSTDGGAVGTYSFSVQLPANATVTNVYADEQTAVTGADDIKVQAGSTDLTASTDFTASSGPRSMTLASSATAIKVTAASELKMVITTNAALTGKIRFAVEYYVSK